MGLGTVYHGLDRKAQETDIGIAGTNAFPHRRGVFPHHGWRLQRQGNTADVHFMVDIGGLNFQRYRRPAVGSDGGGLLGVGRPVGWDHGHAVSGENELRLEFREPGAPLGQGLADDLPDRFGVISRAAA